MANGRENLRPFDTLSEEEQRAIRSKGGKASVKKRREKKMLKELLEIALSQPSEDNPDMDNWTAVTVALLNKAKGGDTRAYEVMRDTIGQKPTDKLEANIDSTINITVDVGE